MSLVEDAIPTTSTKNNNFPHWPLKNRINKDTLKEMVIDLELLEIISIIFLMTDQYTDISQVLILIEENQIEEILLIKFIEQNDKNHWEEKLLEILIIIGNFNIIKKLGFTQSHIRLLKEQHLCNIHNITPNLNRGIKSLYFLCEHLINSEVNKLVFEVNKCLNRPLKQIGNNTCLEHYILHWLKEKYITIDHNNPNLDNLLKNLEDIGLLHELPFNFDSWKSKEKIELLDPCIIQNNSLLKNERFSNHFNKFYKYSNTLWSEEHLRLCIIINEINFTNKIKYKTRLGSNLDEKNLKDTFEGCSFEIEIYQDLTKNEMIIFLDSLNEPPYNNYGSIFLCILSHGYEGEVIFSDSEAITIKTIEEKFCCQNLQNTFKFVILQSCQGRQLGVMERNLITDDSLTLVTDGLSALNIDSSNCPIYHMHFGLFQATINNFVAMRNESKGTWFIQDICNELKNSTPINVKEWVQNVTKRLSERRDKSIYYKKDIVQVPRFISSISIDYILPQYHEKY